MDFALSAEQKAIQELAQNFAEQDLAPHAAQWDKTSFFPVETFKKAATLGFGGIYVSPDFGGCGLNRLEGSLIFDALSQGCVSSAAYLSIHNMVGWMIDQFGTGSQKSEILPKITTCETLTSYCLTEPGAGSDAASLTTSAEKKGDTYVLNGRKTFISGAGTSGLYVVMARTGDAGPKGITCFLVEKGTPGLSFGAPEHKMGWKSQPTADVTFDNCVVPETRRLGTEGQGFKIAMAALDGGRINIASCSLGGARSALNRSLQYTQERKQFGKSLNQFQALQFRLSEMNTQLEASTLMVHKAAWALSHKAPGASKACAMAKLFATEACFKIVDEALQMHGGYGYMQEYEIERLLRDLRVHRILEGTNEIMKLIIARKLLEVL